ncbi:Putative urea carboxylase [Termitomyces sp. J132]|nr:Putative urea carboxylase [Termitomyces sp. J132]
MDKGTKLLIKNRGKIAVCIICTARELGIWTIAIYMPSDALSLHISPTDKAIPLLQSAAEGSAELESKAYLAGQRIISICLNNKVTMLHLGYEFLSEIAEFALIIVNSGITWLGPCSDLIQKIELKHEAWAVDADIPIVPGSFGVLASAVNALEAVKHIGYPVILKATAGGRGIGMVVCDDKEMLEEEFFATHILVAIYRAIINLNHSTVLYVCSSCFIPDPTSLLLGSADHGGSA